MRKARVIGALVIALFVFVSNLGAWDLVEIPIPGSDENIIWYDPAGFNSNGVLIDSIGDSVLVNNALVMLSLSTAKPLDIFPNFSKETFLRDMRSANLEGGLNAFSANGPANYYEDFSVIREDIIADYQQGSLVFCCAFSCKYDLFGTGRPGDYHGKAIRFFRFSGDTLLNGSLIYLEELIDESISTVTDSLIGDIGIKKDYSI